MGKDGRIAKIFPKVNNVGHVKDVIEAIKSLV
jgi:peroxiredoxin